MWGVDEEAVKDIPYEQFLKITTSRNRRTLLRLNQHPKLKTLIEKVRKLKKANAIKKAIRTHVREAIILPEWVGITFAVYNGKEFKLIPVTFDKVGRRLGDFSHSTTRVLHSGPGVGATRGSKFVPLK